MSIDTKMSRWIVVTCALALVFFVLQTNGVLLHVIDKDQTFISFGIMAIFLIAHFFILLAIRDHSEELEDRLWYIAESLISLGMVGTVIGFTIVFGDAFINLDIEKPETVQDLLITLGAGVGTALYTTLTGLVCSMVLKGELVFLVGEHNE